MRVEDPGCYITCLLVCHRVVRCPYLTKGLQPGSLVSVELICLLQPRYSLTTHTHTQSWIYLRVEEKFTPETRKIQQPFPSSLLSWLRSPRCSPAGSPPWAEEACLHSGALLWSAAPWCRWQVLRLKVPDWQACHGLPLPHPSKTNPLFTVRYPSPRIQSVWRRRPKVIPTQPIRWTRQGAVWGATSRRKPWKMTEEGGGYRSCQIDEWTGSEVC